MSKPAQYIIWCPDGTTNPRVVHGTYRRARMAARAMARRHHDRGQVFHVALLLSAHQRQLRVEDFNLDPSCIAYRDHEEL